MRERNHLDLIYYTTCLGHFQTFLDTYKDHLDYDAPLWMRNALTNLAVDLQHARSTLDKGLAQVSTAEKPHDETLSDPRSRSRQLHQQALDA